MSEALDDIQRELTSASNRLNRVRQQEELLDIANRIDRARQCLWRGVGLLVDETASAPSAWKDLTMAANRLRVLAKSSRWPRSNTPPRSRAVRSPPMNEGWTKVEATNALLDMVRHGLETLPRLSHTPKVGDWRSKEYPVPSEVQRVGDSALDVGRFRITVTIPRRRT